VQAARQIRFKGLSEITKNKTALKSYIKDAIALEKSGAKVELKKTAEFSFPEELEHAMDDKPALRTAFEELTPAASAPTCCTSRPPNKPKRASPASKKHPTHPRWQRP
jgi:uncharacterized protein YdeI (YjbR/CyaY-like superfamily)